MMTAAMMKAETRPASRGSRVGASCTTVVSSPTFSCDGVMVLWLTPSLSFAVDVLPCGILTVVVVVVVEAVVVVVEVVVVAAVVEGVVLVDAVTPAVAVILSACTGASDCDVLVISRCGGEVGGGAGDVSVLLVEPKVVEVVVG